MRIVVALSGGVDSAVAAALLAAEGHEVVAVTLRLTDEAGAGGRTCCAPEDLADARRVAAHLGAPFYVLDHRAAFRAAVVADFVAEYRRGRTPSPCVRCNQAVKIGPLVDVAARLGAAGLATGHYARIDRASGPARILRGRDRRKDQSYFLATLPPPVRAALRLPLGERTKDEVRALAARLGLPVAEKPESQEVCFAAGGAAAFVERAGGGPPGAIVDGAGRVLGRHGGVQRYTVGQRRGLGLGGGPWYVVALEAPSARVVVGRYEDSLVLEAMLEGATLDPALAGQPLAVQVRSRHAAAAARIDLDRDGAARVRFAVPQAGVAPGQLAVAYAGDAVVGHGWIAQVPRR